MVKRKLLLLGGSEAQLISIKRAKELGYYTVLCDFLPDNPGQYVADSFYLVSTTDKDAVLEVAKKEHIDGIVAYSSDPAAPTAAYVANALGLHGMNYDIVCHFCEKHLFREFLLNNKFCVPNSVEVKIPYSIELIDCSNLRFPMIVKPTDSSGSKGVTVIYEEKDLADALKYAEEYSRNKTLIIEEFIVRDHPYVIEAEIFVLEGKVVSWGLINSIRDDKSNPLLPSAYSYPLDISEERKMIIKNEISRLVAATGNNTSGAFNIEMIIDSYNRLFFLDAGPRNGGNMLPEFISMISGKDIVGATLQVAMGDVDNIDVELDGESGGYWGLGVLHSDKKGKFNGISYSQKAKHSLIRENIQKNIGQEVCVFERCNNLVGLNFLKFNTKLDMDNVMCNMYESMRVELL